MKKKGICSAIVVLLAVGLCLARPVIGGAAEDTEYLKKPCSVTVQTGNKEYEEDMEEAQVVLELYKVADAVAVQGNAGYVYELTEAYKGLTVKENPEREDWMALAEEAAKRTLDPEENRTPTAPDVQGNPGERIETGSGLYLLVARGSDLETYTDVIQTEDGEKLVTVAKSPRYTYLFEPQLLSLPVGDPENGAAMNTVSSGNWVYDTAVALKTERVPRYGSLEIVKTLQSYETKEPAMFVFQIEAVLDGETVYSDVESLIFEEAGRQKIRLENQFPAGAQVTVTEVYSGAVYHLETEESQTVEIVADSAGLAEFINDYEEEQKGGHGVVNQFNYSGTGAFDGWEWTQISAGNPE